MSKFTYIVLSLFVVATSAFVPVAKLQAKPVAFAPSSALYAYSEDMYWEGEYPPSKVSL